MIPWLVSRDYIMKIVVITSQGISGKEGILSAVPLGDLTPAPPRATRQRSAVAAALAEFDDFRSAQDIHAMLRTRGEGVGLTTIYRALQTMAENGEVDVLRRGDGEAVYRRCSTHHHHHLVCRSCGYTVEVEGPAVERWAVKVAKENGFADISHNVEVFGVCAECAKRPR